MTGCQVTCVQGIPKGLEIGECHLCWRNNLERFGTQCASSSVFIEPTPCVAQTSSLLSPTRLWNEGGRGKHTEVSLEQILSRPTLCREGPSVTARGGERDLIGCRANRKKRVRLVVWAEGRNDLHHSLRGLLWPWLSLLHHSLRGLLCMAVPPTGLPL